MLARTVLATYLGIVADSTGNECPSKDINSKLQSLRAR